MKIRPVILCGGAGTRLWAQSNNNLAKQFIDFGGWSLLKILTFSIKWSAAKNIKGCSFGISLINAEAKIAGAVFLLEGSNTILYCFTLNFFR